MFNKPFDQVDKAYIESLIADKVVEAKHVDYKEILPGDTDKDKNRFVEDVCAFANAAGGDIVFGIRDKRDDGGQKTGTPEYVGLRQINLDQEKLRLEHIVLNKVEPRIPGIQFRLVEGFNGGPVLVMRIPRSYNAPHMTRHDGRFRSRTDSGNYAMDVQEIRSTFISSETLPTRIRQFRTERLARIVTGETPRLLHDGPKMVLHVVPLSAFDKKEVYDLSVVHDGGASMLPISASGASDCTRRYNFDGLLTYVQPAQQPVADSYTQLFRDGSVEAVDAYCLRASSGEKVIGDCFEDYAIKGLKEALRVQRTLGVEPPLLVMLSLTGVRGYKIGRSNGYSERSERHKPIDRDDLLPQEVVFEEDTYDVEKKMCPIFNVVWNAADYPRSMNYDAEGNRQRRR